MPQNTTSHTIARRQALRRLAFGGLGAAATHGWVADLAARALAHAESGAHSVAAVRWRPKILTTFQAETVAAIAESIIPQTDTPGARAARVHEFIDGVLADAEPVTRNNFLNGLSWINQRCRARHDVDFIKATPAQQVALLMPLSAPVDRTRTKEEKESAYVSAQPLQQDRAEAPPDPIALEFFKSMKSMTITGYYTSEIGMKEELGDDGNMFFEDYLGCDDPAYKQKPAK
ncbi:MAG: gluconate 2-dehydrogenase subunit 3 family protein [Acidobacteria bacterium]|nr:gluconate 2-dehydrogenase subunit 3 family protein [Acidobacteriota bacterium]